MGAKGKFPLSINLNKLNFIYSFYLLVEMGLPLHLYPAYIGGDLDQLFIK